MFVALKVKISGRTPLATKKEEMRIQRVSAKLQLYKKIELFRLQCSAISSE